MAQVTVEIDGKSYRMACDPGQEDHLVDLAGRFDKYVSHLKGSFGEIGDQRLTVMAGIMVMDELSEVQGKLKGAESELDLIKDTRDRALVAAERSDEDIAKALSSVAQKISNIALNLNSKA